MLDLLEVELRVRSLLIDRQNQYIRVVSDNTTTVSEITKVFTNASPMEARPLASFVDSFTLNWGEFSNTCFSSFLSCW